MSFPEYGQFPGAQQEGAPGSAPPPQDNGAAPGQPADPSAQQQMSFPTGNGNNETPGGPGGDQKTTLW
jgi:hypothetical protein